MHSSSTDSNRVLISAQLSVFLASILLLRQAINTHIPVSAESNREQTNSSVFGNSKRLFSYEQKTNTIKLENYTLADMRMTINIQRRQRNQNRNRMEKYKQTEESDEKGKGDRERARERKRKEVQNPNLVFISGYLVLFTPPKIERRRRHIHSKQRRSQEYFSINCPL